MTQPALQKALNMGNTWDMKNGWMCSPFMFPCKLYMLLYGLSVCIQTRFFKRFSEKSFEDNVTAITTRVCGRDLHIFIHSKGIRTARGGLLLHAHNLCRWWLYMVVTFFILRDIPILYPCTEKLQLIWSESWCNSHNRSKWDWGTPSIIVMQCLVIKASLKATEYWNICQDLS